MCPILAGLLLAITVQPADAGDVELWNETGFTVARIHRVTWKGTVGLRANDGLSRLYQQRVQTGVSIALGSKVSLWTRYLWRNNRLDLIEDDPGFQRDHRWIVGVSYPLLTRSVSLKASTYYERHFGHPVRPAFNRYRQSFEIELPEKAFSPWIFEDLAFLDRGLFRSRTRAGVRWRNASGISLKIAYQFETIKVFGWRPRHTVYTAISIDRPLWKRPR